MLKYGLLEQLRHFLFVSYINLHFILFVGILHVLIKFKHRLVIVSQDVLDPHWERDLGLEA